MVPPLGALAPARCTATCHRGRADLRRRRGLPPAACGGGGAGRGSGRSRGGSSRLAGPRDDLDRGRARSRELRLDQPRAHRVTAAEAPHQRLRGRRPALARPGRRAVLHLLQEGRSLRPRALADAAPHRHRGLRGHRARAGPRVLPPRGPARQLLGDGIRPAHRPNRPAARGRRGGSWSSGWS